ncbi:MAG TPA: hypothetical protein VKG64_10620 [Methylomirabilota bacterium]|nr:hypothetical protein [Methylomirabilota bacterium]
MRARGPATAALVTATLLLGGAPALAASFALAPADQEAALRVGQRSVTNDAFDAEWRVANGAGDSVMVVTPFHRLVMAGRHAAFRNEKLPPDEPARLLREQQDRLIVRTQLRGPREDFARYLAPRLVVGEREIEPAFVQNERTAGRLESGAYLARCVYGFPTRDLTGRSRVLLIVRDPEGRDVSRFTIDLARMR